VAAPDDVASAAELGGRIAAAVAELPAEQKEVFVMRVELDMPFKTIAEIQGTSINTALSRMQYAVSRLRGLLQEEGREWGVKS
jgi:RNA polymerase sigma-70 factor (ECF subfamily)